MDYLIPLFMVGVLFLPVVPVIPLGIHFLFRIRLGVRIRARARV